MRPEETVTSLAKAEGYSGTVQGWSRGTHAPNVGQAPNF